MRVFMVNIKFQACLLATALFLSGCTSIESLKNNRDSIDAEPKPIAGSLGDRLIPNTDTSNDTAKDVASAQIFKGTGQVINMPKARPYIQLKGDAVVLNFEKVPLEDVVHGILGDILKLDYIIESPIKGSVTLRTQSPIPRDQLLSILETMLQSKRAVMVRDQNNRYIISGSSAVKNLLPGFDNPATKGAGFSHVIVPLEHIGAIEMAEILGPVATKNAFVRIDALRNLLILAGTRTQMDGWLEIISTFDIDLLNGMSVAIFPVEHSNVAEVTQALGTLLATGDNSNILSGLVRVVPLETLGSILVVTPKKQYLDKIKEWIAHLDRAPDYGVEPQLFVYKVQNGEAEHLAQLLSGIFGGGNSISRGGSGIGSGVSPGLTPSTLSSGGISGSGGSTARRQSGASGRSGQGSYVLGNDTRIVADDVNNSLLVYATQSKYRKIENALGKLDVVPLQVLIEASILEVTLSDNLSYGLQWYLDNSLGNGWRGGGQLSDESGISIQAPGFAYAFNNPLGDLRAVLNTLASKDLIRVISTPSIMVLDNQDALIHVGNQEPIRSTQTVTEGGNVSNSITYRDTGVKLDVHPSVNASGLVTMDIAQSVTDITPELGPTGQVGFYTRDFKSRVAVRSGQAVVLGGLISDKNTSGKSGVPFFYKLPIIGSLFGGTSVKESRTELLVIITPHVVAGDKDLRAITQEMRNRMQALSIFDESLGKIKE